MEVYYMKDDHRVYGTAVGFYGDKDGYAVLCMADGTFETVKIKDLMHTAVTARNTQS